MIIPGWVLLYRGGLLYTRNSKPELCCKPQQLEVASNHLTMLHWFFTVIFRIRIVVYTFSPDPRSYGNHIWFHGTPARVEPADPPLRWKSWQVHTHAHHLEQVLRIRHVLERLVCSRRRGAAGGTLGSTSRRGSAAAWRVCPWFGSDPGWSPGLFHRSESAFSDLLHLCFSDGLRN